MVTFILLCEIPLNHTIILRTDLCSIQSRKAGASLVEIDERMSELLDK